VRFVRLPLGYLAGMPTEPTTPSVADVVRRAVEICDPDGADLQLADLAARFEDRDEPITAIADLDEQLAEAKGAVDPQDENPAVVMMTAVIMHLSHRRDEVGADDSRLLQQAARDEFDGHPPENVTDWLRGRGVEP
jgi:hypothetical protein